MLARGLLKLLQQLRFASLRIDGHFAGFNLLLGGAVITEFADAEALLRANRWSKDAAGHWAGLVQVTEAGGGIERGTGFVVAKVLKAGFRFLRGVQQAGYGITGKAMGEALHRFPRPLAKRLGSLRFADDKLRKSLLQTGRVELIYGEDANAALCATRLADQPLSATPGGVGQCRVEYLHQFVVARRKHRTMLNRRNPGKINRVYQVWMNGRLQKR
jgi:hypothetical protein